MAPRPALTSVVSRPGSVQSGTGQVAAIAGLRGLRDAEGPAVEAGDQKGRKDSAHGVWEGLDDLRKGGHHALPGHEEAEQPDDWVPTYGCDGSHAESLAELCRAAERVEGLLVEAQEGTRGGVVGGHSHAHLGKEPSLLAAVVSGIINFLLMFGLCCAYGMIMFDEVNAKWQSLGVKMSLATSAFCGLIVAACSRIPVAIAGPDLNPIVFLGSFVATMAPVIAASVGLSYPGQDEFTCGRRLESRPRGLAAVAEAVGARLLGAAGGAACAGAEDSFCREGSDSYDAAACSEYNQQLVTTTIFAVAFSSALLGLLLFLAGRFNLSRYVNYVPTSISEAFLSCVGYKVFAYALKFCKYDPKTFLPAVVIGVILYFLKANHIGNPAVVIPSMLLIPLAIFHVLVAYGVFYEDLEHARTENVMFPIVDNIDFWTIWAEGVFDGNEWKFQHINFAAWLKTIPDLVTMIIVVMVDCLLKLKGTENKLPVVPEVTYECQLYGACNALMCLCGSPCGYMQLKFNVINFGILGNAKDRRGGIIYALLCAVCFLWTTAAFNYLPRFFLGMLLFFAGAGFVAENLYGSSKYMSFKEWLEVIAILLVFIISGQLIYAVGVGILLTATFFTLQYASLPLLSGEPCRGGSITSHARRNPLTRMAARHIANAWFFVMPLKGYIFFASAKKMVELVKASMQSRSTLTICLYASGGDSLGLELRDCGDGKSLEVTGIASDGAVAEWNRNNPKETIEHGDKIVNVIPGGIGTSLPPLSSDPMSCHSFRRLLARGGPLHISLVRVSSHHYKRTRFAILDCSLLDGMDASACAVFRKLITEANGRGTKFLWTNLAPPVLTSLKGRGVIADPSTCFRKLNDAVFHVEELVLQYRREKVDQWLKVHPDLRIRHKQVSLARSFEPFTHVFEADAERRGCPWLYCSRLRMHRFRTILWGPGQEEQCLFLIHSGAVGIYASLSSNGQDLPMPPRPATERRQRGGSPSPCTRGAPSSTGSSSSTGSPRTSASRPRTARAFAETRKLESWLGRMSRQRPLMAAAILKAVMRQQLQEAEDSQAAHGRASSEPRREGRPPAGQSRAPAPGGAAAWDAPAGKDLGPRPWDGRLPPAPAAGGAAARARGGQRPGPGRPGAVVAARAAREAPARGAAAEGHPRGPRPRLRPVLLGGAAAQDEDPRGADAGRHLRGGALEGGEVSEPRRVPRLGPRGVCRTAVGGPAGTPAAAVQEVRPGRLGHPGQARAARDVHPSSRFQPPW
ncbi:unnamed protein product [Prorocentrum cordatum]|uniref:STAS domain-containing protein n=1 Tax=Prorocentrum cordatum TaxID=2364126 RepID=A0ABN9UT84_9DINO|nr:unnamed protein product [Polarella glacialis]